MTASFDFSKRRALVQTLGMGSMLAASVSGGAAAAEQKGRKDALPERSVYGEGRAVNVNNRIYRDIDRPDPKLVDRLRSFGPGMIIRALAGPLGTCGIKGQDEFEPRESSGRSQCKLGAERGLGKDLRPVRPGVFMIGPAFTVKAMDHLMPMYATELAKPGDVLVIDATYVGSDVAIWGGSMNQSAANKQLGGCVIDGQHCDSGGFLTARPGREVPLFTRGIGTANTTWELPGSINVPVTITGRIVEPGDVMIGGDDGVMCLPKDLIQEAIYRAEAFTKAAKYWAQEKDKGRTWFDILSLRGNVDRLGIPEFPRRV